MEKIRLLKQLRIIGFWEGVSYLILLFIAMPLKYFFQLPEAVLYFGWVHGALFIAYAVATIRAWVVCKWPFKKALMVGLISLIPFGTFWYDKVLREEQESYS